MASEPTRDQRIRLQAFEWLKDQVEIHDGVLPWKVLIKGFDYDGSKVTLVSTPGIHKPAAMSEIPLSIRTSPHGLYDDRSSEDGSFLYKYRNDGPDHRDNVGLRKAMNSQTPLIYFVGLASGKYIAEWPAYVVGDDVKSNTFIIKIDEARFIYDAMKNEQTNRGISESDKDDARRTYITSLARRRVHQRAFRERVLRAYREQCSLCRLKHLELLDAAHIIPDSEPAGEPIVSNGIALCKIHHAAFDRNILGIRPDYHIEVREDILDETDGPMLLHGLQGLHNTKIQLPRADKSKPNPDLLNLRYKRFKEAV